MAWTRSTDGNKTVFTKTGESDANHPGLKRIVFDPDAPADQRVTAELSYWLAEDETADSIAAHLEAE